MNLSCFQRFEFRTSLGTSVFLSFIPEFPTATDDEPHGCVTEYGTDTYDHQDDCLDVLLYFVFICCCQGLSRVCVSHSSEFFFFDCNKQFLQKKIILFHFFKVRYFRTRPPEVRSVNSNDIHNTNVEVNLEY